MVFWRCILLMVFSAFISATTCAQETVVRGLIFEDQNGNGVLDADEQLLKGIPVSSLSQIVLTNHNGMFELTAGQQDIIFVIKPSDYHFHIKSNFVPDFFRLIYPDGSPRFLNYLGVESVSTPDTLYFPLLPSSNNENILVNMVADPQIPRTREAWFFCETIIPAMARSNANFSIFLGDIADNNLGIYPEFMASLKALNTPVYGVFGNHDINYRSPNNKYKAETFRSHFGPDYYSFNYGKTHFIALNSVNYKGWNEAKNIPGNYFGGIDSLQFEWLKKDLELVDDDFQIVLLSHIPLHPNYFEVENMQRLFALIENRTNVTAVSGHLHRNESWQYNNDLFWNGKAEFRSVVAGSACGSWWSGPHAEDSIPAATCVDGSPQGFFQYQFSGTKYDYTFIPAKQPLDFQMRIATPHRQISKSDIAWQDVIVNVFAGDERCRVTFSVDGGEAVTMTQYTGIDPFIDRTHYRRINGDNWRPSMAETKHLWKGKLPQDLPLGTFSLQAESVFSGGRKYAVVVIFELVE